MTTQLREAIARLRRTNPRGSSTRRIFVGDLMLICDALEASLTQLYDANQRIDRLVKPRFDKVAYQREYMRKQRKRAKLLRDSTRWLPPT